MERAEVFVQLSEGAGGHERDDGGLRPHHPIEDDLVHGRPFIIGDNLEVAQSLLVFRASVGSVERSVGA